MAKRASLKSSRRRAQVANSNTPPRSASGELASGERDYFREPAPKAIVPLNGQVQPSITPARIMQSVRMRADFIKGLTPQKYVSYLDQFRGGFFRQAAMCWDAQQKRDYQIKICEPKRVKSVARHGYEIMTVAEIPDGMEALAEEQQSFLQSFYDHVSVTTALNPDEEGGLKLLVRQMMDAKFKYYAVHEIVWQPQEDGSLTAKFIFCPLWWFEGTKGKLRFLENEFGIYGQEMLPGEWLVTCGDGVMEAIGVLYLFKNLPLKSWISYLDKFGMPGLHLKTDAQKDSAEWNDAMEALQSFAEEFATVTNKSCDLTLIEASKSGQATFGELVEKMDRAITQLCRGADLGTQSSQDATGASLQEDESEILETDDAAECEETLTAKVSRYALAWKFGPDVPQLAYLKLRTTPRKTSQQDVAVDTFLRMCGFPMTHGDLAQRYNRPLPEGADPEAEVAPMETPSPGGEGRGEGGSKRSEISNAEFANKDGFVTIDGHVVFVGPENDETDGEGGAEPYTEREKFGAENRRFAAEAAFEEGKIDRARLEKEWKRAKRITGQQPKYYHSEEGWTHDYDEHLADKRRKSEITNDAPANLAQTLQHDLGWLFRSLKAVANLKSEQAQRQALAELVNDAPQIKALIRQRSRLKPELLAELEKQFAQGVRTK